MFHSSKDLTVSYLLSFQYSLKKLIETEVKHLFGKISKNKFDFPDKLNTRDFVHLYNFQKFFLHKSISRFIELIKVKQYHYWNERRNIAIWQQLGKIVLIVFENRKTSENNFKYFKKDMNLKELSHEAAELVMSFPRNIDKYCECVEKISKFICIQISIGLEKGNATIKHFIDDDYSCDFECEYSNEL